MPRSSAVGVAAASLMVIMVASRPGAALVGAGGGGGSGLTLELQYEAPKASRGGSGELSPADRGRQLQQGGSDSVVARQTSGIYYFTAFIGTPPRPVRLNLDTGSATMAVPGPLPDCPSCEPSADLAYDHRSSSTARLLECFDQRCNGCESSQLSAATATAYCGSWQTGGQCLVDPTSRRFVTGDCIDCWGTDGAGNSCWLANDGECQEHNATSQQEFRRTCVDNHTAMVSAMRANDLLDYVPEQAQDEVCGWVADNEYCDIDTEAHCCACAARCDPGSDMNDCHGDQCCDAHCCSADSAGSCQFSVHYGDGSGISGFLVDDQLEIGGAQLELLFGVWDTMTPSATSGFAFEPAGIDGIFGLALPDQECSPTCSPTPMSKLLEAAARAHAPSPGLFALCLEGSGGGGASRMDVGFVDRNKFVGQQEQWVSMQYRGGAYDITAPSGISVEPPPASAAARAAASHALDIAPADFGERVIVDSGTTSLLLKWEAYEKLADYLDATVNNSSLLPTNGTCVDKERDFDPAALDSLLPTISFRMQGQDGQPFVLSLRPSMYMNTIVTDSGEKELCFGIVEAEDETILGDVFMRPFYTVFDTSTAGPRVGLFDRGGRSCDGQGQGGQPRPPGCTDPNYLEFDGAPNTPCATPVVLGCLSPNFQEYSPAANRDEPVRTGPCDQRGPSHCRTCAEGAPPESCALPHCPWTEDGWCDAGLDCPGATDVIDCCDLAPGANGGGFDVAVTEPPVTPPAPSPTAPTPAPPAPIPGLIGVCPLDGAWRTDFDPNLQIRGADGSYLGNWGALHGIHWTDVNTVRGVFRNANNGDREAVFVWTFHRSDCSHFDGQWGWELDNSMDGQWNGDRIGNGTPLATAQGPASSTGERPHSGGQPQSGRPHGTNTCDRAHNNICDENGHRCEAGTDTDDCTRISPRLVGENRAPVAQDVKEGTLQFQVGRGGEYGYVCDDGFDQAEAVAVCADIGYRGVGVTFRTNVQLPDGDSYAADDLNCPVSAPGINFCTMRERGDDCLATEGVFLNCGACTDAADCEIGVRLVDGHGAEVDAGVRRGRLQFRIGHGEFGYVCDDHFGQSAAVAACADLGYTGAGVGFQIQISLPSGDRFAADDVNCPAGAEGMSDCTMRTHGDNCGATKGVSLNCGSYDDSCPFANNNDCDEPQLCPSGTDISDCFRHIRCDAHTSCPLAELYCDNNNRCQACSVLGDGNLDERPDSWCDVIGCHGDHNCPLCCTSDPGLAAQCPAADFPMLAAHCRAPTTSTSTDDSCRYAHDGTCDEPQFCSTGTDCSDCRTCTDVCGGTLIGAGEFGDGDGEYGHQEDCVWHLSCTSGSPALHFSSFDTESNFDWVTVIDGRTAGGRVLAHESGSILPQDQQATGATMTVHFVSDGSVSADGFSASFSCSRGGGRGGGSCSGGSAINLASTLSPYNGDTSGSGDNYQLLCGGHGNEAMFSIQLQPGQSIDIGMDDNSYDSRHETSWGGSCPGQNVVACTDDPDTARHQWTNDQGSPQAVFFVIDAYSSGSGSFTLSWSVSGESQDDSCRYARDGEVSGQRSIILCLRSSTGHQIRVQPLSELYVAAAV